MCANFRLLEEVGVVAGEVEDGEKKLRAEGAEVVGVAKGVGVVKWVGAQEGERLQVEEADLLVVVVAAHHQECNQGVSRSDAQTLLLYFTKNSCTELLHQSSSYVPKATFSTSTKTLVDDDGLIFTILFSSP